MSDWLSLGKNAHQFTKHQAENGATLTSPSVLSSLWGAKQASSWQDPQTTGRTPRPQAEAGMGSQGGRPLVISPAPAALSYLPPCSRGHKVAFVLLKGLLRWLGIRLRDQTRRKYSPQSSSLELPFLSKQPVPAEGPVSQEKKHSRPDRSFV